MTEDAEEEVTESSLNFDNSFWAINEGSELKVPAVFLDDTTGSEGVLLFTSKELATKYCYLVREQATPYIYKLDVKRVSAGEGKPRRVVQSELIRIARTIKKEKLDHIKWFVVDHAGRRGKAHYLSVDDVATHGRSRIPDNVTTVESLETFLSKQMED